MRREGSPSVRASAGSSSRPCIPRTSCRRSASPPRASRERSSPARNAAGTTNSELTREPQDELGAGELQQREQQQADDAGDAREHGATARARRRAPAGEHHQRDREAGARDEPLTRRVQRQRQVLVRSEQQEVSRQLVEGVHRELQDELEHERADQQALAPGLEPSAGQVAEQQRDDRHAPDVLEAGSASTSTVGESIWPSTGQTNSPKPVAVISMPTRLSGRRRHATRPQAANEPPTVAVDEHPRRLRLSGAEDDGHQRDELRDRQRGPHGEAQNVAGRGVTAKRDRARARGDRDERERIESRHGRDPRDSPARETSGCLPIHGRRIGSVSTPLLGRAAELARLDEVLEDLWRRRLARRRADRRAGHRQDPPAGGADRSRSRARRAGRSPGARPSTRPTCRSRRGSTRSTRTSPRIPGSPSTARAGPRCRASCPRSSCRGADRASSATASTPRCARCWPRSPPTPRSSSCSTTCTGPTRRRST